MYSVPPAGQFPAPGGNAGDLNSHALRRRDAAGESPVLGSRQKRMSVAPGEGDWVPFYDELLYTWSGPGSFDPEEDGGTYSTWTVPSSVGKKTITVTASDDPPHPDADDATHPSGSIDVYVVKVEKIQYYDAATEEFVDVPNPLHVVVGDTVTFQAIKDDGGWGVSWPQYYQKPCWGGTSGASGSGEPSVDVTFNIKSSDGSDFKTVIAECGNSVTVNVLVHELDITEPQTKETFNASSWIGGTSYRLDWQAVAGEHGNTNITLTVVADPQYNFGDDLGWFPVCTAVGTLSPAVGMTTTLTPHAEGSGVDWIYAMGFGQIGAAVELVLYPSHIARVLYTFPHGSKCGDSNIEVGPEKDYTASGSIVCGQAASLCQDGVATNQPSTDEEEYTRVPATKSFKLESPLSAEAQAAVNATVEGDIVRYGDDEDNPQGHWATVCDEYHRVWSATAIVDPWPNGKKCYFDVAAIEDVYNPDNGLTHFIIWVKP